MKNTNNKRIYLSLGILVILAFAGFLVPKAGAQTNYVANSMVSINPAPAPSNQAPYPTPANTMYNPGMPTQTVYYYPTPAQTVTYTQPRNVVVRTVPVPQESNVVMNSGVYNNGSSYNNTMNSTNAQEEDYNGLAANAIYGNSSFLPNGFLQWIVVAIMITLIILMARRVFGASHRYHNSPLKHA